MIQRSTTDEIIRDRNSLPADIGEVEWVLAEEIKPLEDLLQIAKDFMLELLVHADQPPSEECKTRARAFVKAFDEKVKNGQQQQSP